MSCTLWYDVQEYLGDIAGSVPDYHNKANIAIKQDTRIFWFPNAYKTDVYHRCREKTSGYQWGEGRGKIGIGD